MNVAHRFVLYGASAQGETRLPSSGETWVGFIPKSTLHRDAVAGDSLAPVLPVPGRRGRGGGDALASRKGLLCRGVASRELPLRSREPSVNPAPRAWESRLWYGEEEGRNSGGAREVSASPPGLCVYIRRGGPERVWALVRLEHAKGGKLSQTRLLNTAS